MAYGLRFWQVSVSPRAVSRVTERSLTSVIIPSSVTHIGDDAFLGCSSLNDVGIPSSVTHIGNDAFDTAVMLTPR